LLDELASDAHVWRDLRRTALCVLGGEAMNFNQHIEQVVLCAQESQPIQHINKPVLCGRDNLVGWVTQYRHKLTVH
jgi:hypothetical protein